ncbi:OLC1v1032788C1 [Oldenlandia corymbosa var. corymbosa]|uniref:OLC1v1032788C1 n=1 Tax=Oldenlandia corymbosa var. corymbosa TaxID=529605 RepID=A0AAV1CPT5_OLDCO|nr:OLC1v1032788C1 [Oldenlandia corymbosa var. corymbosa]
MASAAATPDDPASLTCAACGCHRNFHRQEPDDHAASRHFMPSVTPHFIDFRKSGRPYLSPSPPPPQPPPPPPPPPQHSTVLSYPPASQMLLALSTAAQDDQQVPNHHQFTVATPVTPSSTKSGEHSLSGRKRFRTKFTPQQKERMHSFAESLGWKMQRSNQSLVENFCKEIGVTRGVLKVWMHNNKNTFGSKKETSTSSNPHRNAAAATNNDHNAGNNGGISPHGYNMNSSLNDDGDEDNTNESGDHNMDNGIGSSPSS